MGRGEGLERWTASDGSNLGWKRPSPRQPVSGRVLVLYGNGGCAIGCAHYANGIQSAAAFDVFLLEYPGYGDRKGAPSEQALFRAAEQALPLLDTDVPTYLLGESLGSGVAAFLAGRYPERIAGVVLLSPFNRLADVGQHRLPFLPVRLLLVDRFASEDYLRHYQGPVGIVVDGRDDVVPENFGLRLYDGYTGSKKLWNYPLFQHIVIPSPP
jgi:hypothetical protein